MKIITFKDGNRDDVRGYELDDLDENARSKVLVQHARYMLETMDYDELPAGMQEGIDRSEEMQTPWFVIGYMLDHGVEEVKASVKANDFLYDEEGSLLNMMYYVDREGRVKKTTLDDIEVEITDAETTEG